MGDLQNDIEIPTFFVCPISLEMMKDPVTLSTGITYDRDSIEKWLFSQKKDFCPLTKQVLNVDDIELIPNHTLRRLIQSWCTLNASSGFERLPTPRPPISKTQIIKLLKDAKSHNPHDLQMRSLKRLKTIVLEIENNKRLVESVGAIDYLTSIINNIFNDDTNVIVTSASLIADEALSILYHLKLSQKGLKSLFGKTGEFVETLTRVMERATSYESRAYAIMLLKSMFEVAETMQVMISLNPKFFIELIRILKDQISQKATKTTLKLLINVCSWGRNRIKAAECGAVRVLIDILMDCTENRVSEMVIVVLDQICECAEGRAELLKHDGGLAIVSKKIFRVSSLGNERAVRILYSIARYSGKRSVVEEMLEIGVVGKLCLVVQVNCGKNMKHYAWEILKMHFRVWKNSSCIPNNLISLCPC